MVVVTYGIIKGPSRWTGGRKVDMNIDCRSTDGEISRCEWPETPLGVRGRLRAILELLAVSGLSSLPRGGGDSDRVIGRRAMRAPSAPHLNWPPRWSTVLRVCASRTSPVDL